MKATLVYLAWFLGGAAVGYWLAPRLFGLWFDWGLRAPVGYWIAQHLPERVAARIIGIWGLVWLRIPEVVLVLAAGTASALFVRHRPVLKALLFGLAMVLVPWVTYAPSTLEFGVRVFFSMLAMDAGVVACGLVPPIISSAVRRRKTRRGFEVSAAQLPATDLTHHAAVEPEQVTE